MEALRCLHECVERCLELSYQVSIFEFFSCNKMRWKAGFAFIARVLCWRIAGSRWFSSSQTSISNFHAIRYLHNIKKNLQNYTRAEPQTLAHTMHTFQKLESSDSSFQCTDYLEGLTSIQCSPFLTAFRLCETILRWNSMTLSDQSPCTYSH